MLCLKCSLLPSLTRRCVVCVSPLRLSAVAVVRPLLLADGMEEEAHWRVERSAAYLVSQLRRSWRPTCDSPLHPAQHGLLLRAVGGSMAAAVAEVAGLLFPLLLFVISLTPQQAL